MKTFHYVRETHVDEIPPMSTEWQLREAGFDKIANELPGPSWLDYFATRKQKWNVGLISDEL